MPTVDRETAESELQDVLGMLSKMNSGDREDGLYQCAAGQVAYLTNISRTLIRIEDLLIDQKEQRDTDRV